MFPLLLERFTKWRCGLTENSVRSGIHIYLPVDRLHVRAVAHLRRDIARTVTAEHPNLVTSERIVAKRPAGRVLIDVQQNATPTAAAAIPCALSPSAEFPPSVAVITFQLAPRNVEHKDGLCAPKGEG